VGEGWQALGVGPQRKVKKRDHYMATTAKVAKEIKPAKFKIRLRHRCQRCGRPRAYMRKFALCRLCFRKLALEGDIAGVTKSSW
jgi:small subunit ribosomal protein S14